MNPFFRSRWLGVTLSLMGQIPVNAALLTILIKSSTYITNMELLVGGIVLNLAGFAMVAVPLGLIAARLADSLFRNSTISPVWATIGLVGLVDACLIGWALVVVGLVAPTTYDFQ